jgi:hypothetical protein
MSERRQSAVGDLRQQIEAARALVAEEWRPVAGHAGYEVSNLGRVRSVDRVVEQPSRWGSPVQRRLKGRLIALRPDRKGYLYVWLGKGRGQAVHRLVLLAFVGPCSDRCEGAHGDGNPANNALANLAWKTRKENHADKRRHGTQTSGERHPGWSGSSCRNGHERRVENTRIIRGRHGSIRRVCRTCQRESYRIRAQNPAHRALLAARTRKRRRDPAYRERMNAQKRVRRALDRQAAQGART